MRRGGGKAKGSAFEREICADLSRWWTDGSRDDIFWRSATSGGRSSIRHKKGRTATSQAGDICAVDPIGAKLLRVMTFELKHGYKGTSLHDMLDRPKTTGACEFAKWVQQVIAAQDIAKSFTWAIIVRRHGKTPVIFFNSQLVMRLPRATFEKVPNQVHVITRVPDVIKNKKRIYMARDVSFVGMPLAAFLSVVKPKHIIEVARWWREEQKRP